jgi:hypothetical protein
MSSNFFSDIGLIFFVTCSFVLTKLSIAAFGRDLLSWRVKNSSELHRQSGYPKNS